MIHDKLNDTNMLFKTIWDNSTEGMRITDKNGKVLAVNKAYCQMTGVEEKDLIGNEFTAVYADTKDLLRFSEKYKKEFIKKCAESGIETELTFNSGKKLVVFVNYSYIDIDNNTPLLLTTFKDVTNLRSTENSLQREKVRSRKYIDISAAIILEIGVDQKVRFINRRGIELLEYSIEEIIGKNWFDKFIPSHSRQNVINFYNEYCFSDISPNEYYEYTIITKSGQERLIAWHNFVIKNEQNDVTAILCSGEDITDIKNTELVLQETREKLLGLFENSVDFVYTLDDRGRFTNVNKAAEELTGFRKEELIGMDYKSYIPSKNTRKVFMAFYKVFKYGEPLRRFPVEIIIKNGAIKHFETSVSPLRENGKVVGLYGISRDVTTKKITETALRESEEKFRSVAETAGEAIISLNCQGKIMFWNKTAENIFGYTIDEAIGQSISIILPQSSQEKHEQNFQQVFQENIIFSMKSISNVIATRKNNEEFPIDISIASWKLRGEINFTVIIRDITERKKSELEREVLYKIVENVSTSTNFNDMLINIYENIKRVIYARNCYIALSDPLTETISFPLFRDEHDPTPKTRAKRNGLTEYMLKKATPLLLTKKEIDNLIKNGQIEKIGTVPVSWVGVPLFINYVPLGVLAVQSYSNEVFFTEQDKNLLLAIGSQVAFAIERKKADEVLRTSENRFRAVFETAEDAIFIKNKELKYTHVNSAMQKIFKLTEEHFIGKTDTEIFGDKIGNKITAQDKKVLRGEIVESEEFNIAGDDMASLHIIKFPMRGNNFEIVGLCGISRNITERIKMEKAIETERQLLLTTLRSIRDGVITTDLHGKIVLVNKTSEKLTGWKQSEAENRDIDEIFRLVNIDEIQEDTALYNKLIQAGRFLNNDQYTILVSKDGTKRLVDVSHSEIKDRNNDVHGFVHVFRDVTELIKLREEQQKADKLESVGLLAGGIAHDFNNILTAILSNVSLAKMDTTKESELYEILSDVETASLRARDLTQQLLTFSKGGLPVTKTASIAELIRDSAEFALTGSNVNCRFHIPVDLYPVEMDVGQINQAINNLIINADQAMPTGGEISIHAQNLEFAQPTIPGLKPGRYVQVVIEDQGIGIKKEQLHKVFDPYFTTKQKGSGLGLATCYSIIKKHGGLIEVESKLGEGTRFIIYLPASRQELSAEMSTQDPVQQGTGRILIMDDESIVRNAAGKILQKLGYEVDYACDGKEAIEKYRQALRSSTRYDAVMLDLTIPGGMGGKECIEKLLQIDQKVRAIVSSGYSNDPIMASYRDYGFVGVANKPYKISELGEIIKKVLQQELN